MTWFILVLAVASLIVSLIVQVKVLLALNAIKAAADVVAIDLADNHMRADNAEGPHGAAGDAAARSGDS